MDWENLEQDALNENLLKTLIKLAKVDGEISDNEMVYILKAGLSMNMSEDTIKMLWKEDVDDLVIPNDEQGRMVILYYLIFLTEADQRIDSQEEGLIHHYGLKLGFRPAMITDFLNVVKAKLNKETDVYNLLEEIKKYLN